MLQAPICKYSRLRPHTHFRCNTIGIACITLRMATHISYKGIFRDTRVWLCNRCILNILSLPLYTSSTCRAQKGWQVWTGAAYYKVLSSTTFANSCKQIRPHIQQQHPRWSNSHLDHQGRRRHPHAVIILLAAFCIPFPRFRL